MKPRFPSPTTPAGAYFSGDRVHRYVLWRVWKQSRPLIAFLGLNPSTADETANDPTVRRCIGFARDWGGGGLLMLNIFAFRATDPRVMYAAKNPIGRWNNAALLHYRQVVDRAIAAWGVHGAFLDRGAWVTANVSALEALGRTKDGAPRHPLYLKKTLRPSPFN